MGVTGVGLVIGWCAVGYGASGTIRGGLAATGITVAAVLAVLGVMGSPAALACLGAAVIAAVAHTVLRSRLLSIRARRA